MHEYMMRSLVEQHRHQFMSQADIRRQTGGGRADGSGFQPREVRGIWAEGTMLDVRPIESDDTDRLKRLFGRLTTRSVQLRFFAPIRQLSRSQLTRLVDVDHDEREALVALSHDEIVAVARYARRERPGLAEIAVTVEDTWQQRGIGKRLSRRLSTLAVERGFDAFVASILPENRAALRLVKALSPDAAIRWNHGVYEASIPLR